MAALRRIVSPCWRSIVPALLILGVLPSHAQQAAPADPARPAVNIGAPSDAISQRWPDDGLGRNTSGRAAPATPVQAAPETAPVAASQAGAAKAGSRVVQHKRLGKSARSARAHASKATSKRSRHTRAPRRAATSAARAKAARVAPAVRSHSARHLRAGKAKLQRPLALTPPVLRQSARRS